MNFFLFSLLLSCLEFKQTNKQTNVNFDQFNQQKKKEKIFLPNLIEKRKRNKKKHFYISGTYEKLAVLSGHNNHRYENQPDQSINRTKN